MDQVGDDSRHRCLFLRCGILTVLIDIVRDAQVMSDVALDELGSATVALNLSHFDVLAIP